jgi:tripeptidyl-peptidase-2
VDLIDATGAGDVDISTTRQVDSNGCLTGLTGRKLRIPASWTNPSGEYLVGMKPLYELCSSALRERLKKERKEKLWQPYNDEAVYQAQRRLNEHISEGASPKTTPNKIEQPVTDQTVSSSTDPSTTTVTTTTEITTTATKTETAVDAAPPQPTTDPKADFDEA